MRIDNSPYEYIRIKIIWIPVKDIRYRMVIKNSSPFQDIQIRKEEKITKVEGGVEELTRKRRIFIMS